jgi:Tol biopolymer transport system component
MTSERDFDRLARAWLELGPDEAPDRVVAAVLQAVEDTPQVRRPLQWPIWRFLMMNHVSQAAGAAAVLVVVLGGGILLSQRNQPAVGVPVASPTATAPASLGPTDGPAPTPSTTPTAIASGPPASAGSIAYVVGPEGARELHVIAPDGTGDRSCGIGSAPSWSTDGGTIVFAGPDSVTADPVISFPDVYQAGSDCTGVTKVIKEGNAPHLAPGSPHRGAETVAIGWITFGRGIIDTGDAWIANADGTEPRKLMTGTSPTWSPDGAWLLLNPDSGTFELGLVRPDGTGYNSLGLGNDPSWTPDGRIVYLRSNDPAATVTLRVVALDGTATDLFTAPGELGSPRMLADGRVILVWNGDVWRLDPGSKEPIRLTQGLTVVSGPSPSADGRWAAVAVGGTEPGLVVLSIDGGWVRVLPGIVSAVAWQPVGPVQ